MAIKWFKRKKPAEQNETQTESEEISAPPMGEAQETKESLPDKTEPQEVQEVTPEPEPSEEQISEEQNPRDEADQPPDKPAKRSLFQRLRNGLSKTRKVLTSDIDDLFAKNAEIDDEMLEELEELLITADIGVQTAMDLIEKVSRKARDIETSQDLVALLKTELGSIFETVTPQSDAAPSPPKIVMVIGVNGVGKTTTIGKLAAKHAARGEKVLIAAADTFRAAAVEQLSIWADRADAILVKHKENADPAAVAFDAVTAAKARGVDTVFIDTAGRLHTKVNLMEELKKIKRSVDKALPGAPHETILILDATTGQNAISQSKMFNDALGVDSLILTKLDGTAKGGVTIAICGQYDIPLRFIGVGEGIDDLQTFDPERFIEALF